MSWAWIAIRLIAFSVASDPSLSLTLPRRRAEAARAHQIDADEVAILGAKRVRLGDVQFAAGLLLVDRDQASAAVRVLAEDAEDARPGVIDDLDDPPAIGDAVAGGLVEFFDAQQRAVADAGCGAGLRPPRDMDADFRRLAAFDLVPFGRGSQ